MKNAAFSSWKNELDEYIPSLSGFYGECGGDVPVPLQNMQHHHEIQISEGACQVSS